VNLQQKPLPQNDAFVAGMQAIACLDVSPEGRILTTCSVARAFLKSSEESVLGHFFSEPRSAFVAALQAAMCTVSPRASVLRCLDRQRRSFVQINVLPFQRERIRIILFLPKQTPESRVQSSVVLTEREQAVLELSASGLRRDRIAFVLGIALPTVDMHSRNIRKKLGASTMSAAVANATQQGLLTETLSIAE